MSAPTFYVAAPSAFPVIAKGAMRDLERLGWVNAYDWTGLDAPPADWPLVARDEIDAAANADLFVLATDRGRASMRGALVELGARLHSRKVAHVVGDVGFFENHPNVVRHDSWQAFLSHAESLRVGMSVAQAAGEVL